MIPPMTRLARVSAPRVADTRGQSWVSVDGRTRHELTRRLLITAAALLAYRVGSHIPLPGLEPRVLAQIDANGIEHVSILALGVVPFVSALILFELAKVLAPQLRRWEQSTSANKITLDWMVLILALLVAAAQATGVAMALEGVSGLVDRARRTVSPSLRWHACRRQRHLDLARQSDHVARGRERRVALVCSTITRRSSMAGFGTRRMAGRCQPSHR